MEPSLRFSQGTHQKTDIIDNLTKPISTGTTIVGLIYNGSIFLGADTRSSFDTSVADKNCQKIHYITDKIYACGAGTAADTDRITKISSVEAKLFEEEYKRTIPVLSVVERISNKLYRYQAHIGAALIIGGIDASGAHLFSVSPYGNIDSNPFLAMGSGCLAALSVLELGYPNIKSDDDAIKLVADSAEAGAINDLGSGSNVDILVLTPKSCNFFRGYRVVAAKPSSVPKPIFPKLPQSFTINEIVIPHNEEYINNN